MGLRAGSKAPRESKSKRPDDTAFKQQKLKAWRPILSPRVAIATFFTSGIIFVPIGIALTAVSNQVVEVESADYDAVCASNPCAFNLTVKAKMVAPVYMYYKLSNFYQNHREYVRDREDAQLAGESGLKPSRLQCKKNSYAHAVGSAGLAAAGWVYNSVENVVSPCGLVANSAFNDSFSLEGPLGVALQLRSEGIAWETDRRLKFHNAADGSTGRNFDGFRYWRGASCYDLPDLHQVQPCLDAAAAATTYGPAGWCYPGSGYCNEDEHFIVWMRTAGLPTFRKLYAIIDSDILPGVYTVSVSNGFPDPITGVYMKQDGSGPQLDLFPTRPFKGTKAVVFSTKSSGLGGKNPFLGLAYIVVGAMCLALALGFCVKDRLSPRELGSAPYLTDGGGKM